MSNKEEVLVQARELLNPRIQTLAEVGQWVDYLIEDDLPDYDTSLLYGKLDIDVARDVLIDFKLYIIEKGIGNLGEYSYILMSKFSTKRGNVLWPLRVAISGKRVALPLFESIEILGYEKTLRRLNIALQKLGEYND